jgi:hypothetical protein
VRDRDRDRERKRERGELWRQVNAVICPLFDVDESCQRLYTRIKNHTNIFIYFLHHRERVRELKTVKQGPTQNSMFKSE